MFKLWFLSQTPHSKAASPVPKPQTAASPPLKPTQCLGRGSHPPGSSPYSLYEFILQTPLPRLPFCPRPLCRICATGAGPPGWSPKGTHHDEHGEGSAARSVAPTPGKGCCSSSAASPAALWQSPFPAPPLGASPQGQSWTMAEQNQIHTGRGDIPRGKPSQGGGQDPGARGQNLPESWHLRQRLTAAPSSISAAAAHSSGCTMAQPNPA